MVIRQLMPQDWSDWRQFRLKALQESPENFASSFDEEVAWSDERFKETLSANIIFGVYSEDKLVAAISFYMMAGEKIRHKAVVWGLFVEQTYRGAGAAKALMRKVIEHASFCVKQVHLSCVTSNFNALALYQKFGFVIYGTEPAAIFVNNQYHDEHLMCLDLISN